MATPDFVPANRTLGDVPGLNELLNPISEDTFGMAGFDDVMSFGGSGGGADMSDPFSMALANYRTEMLEAQQPERSAEGVSDPAQRSWLPSGEQLSVDPVTYSEDSSGNWAPTSYSPTVNIDGLDAEQIANAEIIAEVGKDVGASQRDVQIAIMAALVESGMRNLDYGDRDSIGMFQQRDAWGSFEDRIDPYESARMFFLGGQAGQEGLLDKEDRDQMGMGEVAQAVQVSAYPDRYAEREAEAAGIVEQVTKAKSRVVRGYYEGKDPYELTDDGHGHTLDYITRAAWEKANEVFGGELTITQGSHNAGGVSASGGTHDEGGVIDVILDDPSKYDEAVVALRKVGFAAWDRTSDQGPWPRHIHAVLVGHENLAPSAAQQVQSYLNNDNGLVGSVPDDGPRDWVGTVFSWEDIVKDANRHSRQRAATTARGLVGTDFEWGGRDVNGLDRVGFLQSVYRDLGIEIADDEVEIPYSAKAAPIETASLGDMIAFETDDGIQMGVYLDDGSYISADGPGRGIRVNALADVTESAWVLPISTLLERSERRDLRSYQPSFPSQSTTYTPQGSSYSDTPRGYGSSTPAYSGGSSSGGGGSSSSHDNSYDATPQGYGSSSGGSGGGGGGGKGGGGKKNDDPPGGKPPDFGV